MSFRRVRRPLSWVAAAVALIGLALAPSAAIAQAGRTGEITGQVLNATTRRGIAEARVQVVGSELATTTDADGQFRLRGIPVGIASLRVISIGYEPTVASNLPVSSGKPTQVTVELTARAVELEEVTAGGPGFFRSPAQESEKDETLGREDIRRAPGVQEDVVRAVALLPGVGVTTGGRNDLVVRGGAPFENLFLVDGLEVPNINHFGSQGSTGGPISLINIDLVAQANFANGGFGVRYGDRTASVTSITLREGTRSRVAGLANLSITGLSGLAEGPLGKRGSFIVSARRSYLDLIFDAVGFNFRPTFYDVQTKLTQQLGRNTNLSFIAIGALNDLSFNNDTPDNRLDNSRIPGLDQRQLITGLTLTQSLSRGALTVTLGRTYTRFRSFQNDTLVPPTELFSNRSTEREWSLRAELGVLATNRLEVTVGTQAKYNDNLRYAVRLPGELRRDQFGAPQPLNATTEFDALRAAGYSQLAYQFSDRVRATVGGRVDHYDYLAGGTTRFAPRASVSVGLDGRTTVTASAGRYWQGPSFIWLAGDPGNAARLRPIRSDQLGLGLQRLLRPDTKVQLEAYYKRYANYTTRLFRPQAVLQPAGFEDAQNDIPFGLEPLSSEGTGESYGAELLLQKRFSEIPLYGLLSVSANRTRFRGLDGVERPGSFETRFITTATAGYRFNPKWELSGKVRVATGLPSTPFVTAGANAGTLDFTRFNAGPRLPTFYAVDVRVDRRWFFRGLQLVTYLDVQNITNRKNVDQYFWNFRTRAVERNESLGVLPSIGVNVEF